MVILDQKIGLNKLILWQYGLSSFQLGFTNLERILPKNTHTQRKLLNFENWINPNWHETGWIYPPYDFWIGFCQLNFYQKFTNIFGGEN